LTKTYLTLPYLINLAYPVITPRELLHHSHLTLVFKPDASCQIIYFKINQNLAKNSLGPLKLTFAFFCFEVTIML